MQWEFPGGLVVRIPYFHCCGPNSVPGQGADILQSTRRDQKKKKRKKENSNTYGLFPSDYSGDYMHGDYSQSWSYIWKKKNKKQFLQLFQDTTEKLSLGGEKLQKFILLWEI